MTAEPSRKKNDASFLEFTIVIQTYQPHFSDSYLLAHMLVGEGQAQHWMKTANRENPKKSLEFHLGDQPTNLLYEQA